MLPILKTPSHFSVYTPKFLNNKKTIKKQYKVRSKTRLKKSLATRFYHLFGFCCGNRKQKRLLI